MLFNQYFKVLISPLGLCLCSISLFIIFVDMNERFYTGDTSSNKKEEFFEFIPIKTTLLSDDLRAELTQKYAKFNAGDNTVIKENTLPQLTLEQQNGVLREFLIDNKRLTLKAVLSSKENSAENLLALIEIFEPKKNDFSIEKYKNHDEIMGYSINIDSNTQVKLTKNNDGNIHQVVLTMYKAK